MHKRLLTPRFTKALLATVVLLGGITFFATASSVDAISFFPEKGGKANVDGLLTTDGNDIIDLGATPTTVVVISLINSGLSLLALLCLVMLLYGGYLFIWARGNSEVVQKAKEILEGTVIGLVIIISAMGIIRFAFTQLASVTDTCVTGTVGCP